MTKRKAARRWVAAQAADPYVKKRRAAGYRSRAAFKLEQLLTAERLVGVGGRVVDLGAAPGGWTQIARAIVGDRGRVVAVDLLPFTPVAGADSILGDCTDAAVQDAILEALGGTPADLVMSDMAPNITGIKATDEANVVRVVDAAVEVGERVLKPGGSLVFKAFAFEDVNARIIALKRRFERVTRRKPDASRARSAEFYVVARGFAL